MPRKKREIRRDFRRAGFSERQGKGSHKVYHHPFLKYNYTVAGQDGDDALKYDEDNLRDAMALLEAAKRERGQS